jgi:FAD/FMN-containing dehydrogenase
MEGTQPGGDPAHQESTAEEPGSVTADEPGSVTPERIPEQPGRTRRRISRRQVLGHGATALGAIAVGSVGEARIQRWTREAQVPPPTPPRDLLNDASGLNPTPVRGVTFAGTSVGETVRRVAPLLRQIAGGREPPLVVSGARHSMGGHSLLRGGWVLDALPLASVTVDVAHRTMRVGAGATWRTIIPVLNAAGFAPKVMQSNHDFTVGGSLSVNCHGWHTNSPPIASTVRSLRVLTADGTVTPCGLNENAELFGLVLGGYGLYGVILDAELEIVPNVVYEPHFDAVPTRDYAAAFAERVYAPGSRAEMAYGRLSVDPHTFLEEAVIGRYLPVPQTRGTVLPLTADTHDGLRRAIFRNSADNGAGKSLRWWLERHLNPRLAGPVSRNGVLNAPARVLAGDDPDSTDILHEYFVPQPRLWEFAQAARTIIRREQGNLLNVTVRDVRRDDRSALAYARGDMFGLVMLFVQQRTQAGETRMQALTRSLIDAAIASGGTFYLPYRAHATVDQLRRGYPAWDAAIRAKDRYDPDGVFRNTFYDWYRP